MKKLFIAAFFLAFGALGQSAFAQVSFSINIESQPLWGPVGYDHVDYYYIPDVDAYYNVSDRQFIYLEGNRWVRRSELPPRYHHFDLYRADKFVINEPNPYLHHREYRMKYASYRGRHDQAIIRDSHENKYFVIKDHPEHSKWRAENTDRRVDRRVDRRDDRRDDRRQVKQEVKHDEKKDARHDDHHDDHHDHN